MKSAFTRRRLGKQYSLVFYRVDLDTDDHLLFVLLLHAGPVLAALLPLPGGQLGARRGGLELILGGAAAGEAGQGQGRGQEGGHGVVTHDLHQRQPRHVQRVEAGGHGRQQRPRRGVLGGGRPQQGEAGQPGVGEGLAGAEQQRPGVLVTSPALAPLPLHRSVEVRGLAEVLHLTLVRVLGGQGISARTRGIVMRVSSKIQVMSFE